MNDDAHKDDPTDDGDDLELFDDLDDLPELDVSEELLTPSDESEAGQAADADSAGGEAAEATPDSPEKTVLLDEISFDDIDLELTADAGEAPVDGGEALDDAAEALPADEFETAPEFVPESVEPAESDDEMPAEVSFEEEAASWDEVGVADSDEEHPVVATAETAAELSGETKTAEKPFDFEPAGGDKMIVAPAIPEKRSILTFLASILAFLAKVFVGAIVGLVIAQAILWWVFQLDPLGLAGKLPNALAWTAPARMRKMAAALETAQQGSGPTTPTAPSLDPMDPANDGQSDDASTDNIADTSTVPDPRAEDSTDDMLAADVPDEDADEDITDSDDLLTDAGQPDENVVATDEAADLAGSEPGDLSTDLDSMLADTDDTESAPPASDTLAADTPSADSAASSPNENDTDVMTLPEDDVLGDLLGTEPEEATPDASPEWGPVGAPAVTRNDLASAIEVARAADARLDQAQLNRDPSLRDAAKDFYRAFADLAVKATHVDREGADAELESSRQLVSAFEFDDKKQRMIGTAAGGWIKNDLGDGVLVGGSIDQVQTIGQLPQFRLNLFGKSGRSVTVVTPLDPATNPVTRFQNGDRVLLMGVVVRDPARNLRGYAGGEEKVVWLTDQLVRIP